MNVPPESEESSFPRQKKTSHRYRDFIKLPRWLLLVHNSLLSNTAKLVYACLNHYANGQGECSPGEVALSAKLGISVRTARRALADLRAQRLITVEARGQLTNVYRLLEHPWQAGGDERRREGNAAAYGEMIPEQFRGALAKLDREYDKAHGLKSPEPGSTWRTNLADKKASEPSDKKRREGAPDGAL